MDIETIERELKTGQVPPPRLAEMRDWLSVEASSKMDRQDQLVDLYADYFHVNRASFKSDKACDNAWDLTDLGREQRRLETYQKRIKLLIATIASHLRVASDAARNLY
jgi:hypothetical protein